MNEERERQIITNEDVGTVDSLLVTKATAAVQESVRNDLDKEDASLKDLIEKKADATKGP